MLNDGFAYAINRKDCNLLFSFIDLHVSEIDLRGYPWGIVGMAISTQKIMLP